MDSSASPFEDDIIQESLEYESEKQEALEPVDSIETSKFHYFSTYARKTGPVSFDEKVENLRILQLDIDYEIVEQDHFLDDSSSAAVVRIYGVTEDGNSVLVRVHGFRPFFFIYWPSSCSELNLSYVKERLEKSLSALSRKKNFVSPIIRDLEIFEGRSILYFVPNDPLVQYLKITVTLPSQVKEVRDNNVQILVLSLIYFSWPNCLIGAI
jgi:hypothetical protein